MTQSTPTKRISNGGMTGPRAMAELGECNGRRDSASVRIRMRSARRHGLASLNHERLNTTVQVPEEALARSKPLEQRFRNRRKSPILPLRHEQ
jgi:hypothetical protein